jgi:predicted ATPase
MYLKSVKFKESYRCFSQGQTFDFQQLNLLVGDQGCGKSTLLNLIFKRDKILDVKLTDLGKAGVKTFYFDSEKMNPRVLNPIKEYTNLDGTNKGIGLGAAIKARFSSHGETLVCFTVHALKKATNNAVFIDEPESGLSLRNQFRFVEEIKNTLARKCQLFIATHSLVLIQSFGDVLSLEHKQWMKSEDFIQLNSAKAE